MAVSNRTLSAAGYLVCYALWAVTLALGMLDVVALRAGVERVYVSLGLDKWGLATASHSATIVLGLLWLVLVYWVEHAYRSGAKSGRLWQRFTVMTLLQLLPLGLLLWR